MGTICSAKKNKKKLVKKHTELCNHKIDLSIFENENKDELNIKCTNTNLKENKCAAINRITAALNYYSTLNINDNIEHQNLFTEFVNDIYDQLLDDFMHLTTHQLEDINQEFTQCDVMKCEYTSRHHENNHGIEHEEKEFQLSDPIFDFYKRTMDGLHFYLYHCYDAGLRVRQRDYIGNQYENDDEITDDPYFDATFSKINKYVSDRKRITKSFERFSTNNRFTVQLNSQEKNTTTPIDEMYLYLQKMNIVSHCIQKLKQFIETEEYDTDCIQYEFQHKNDIQRGNISTIIDNNLCDRHIYEFVQSMKISASSFSIGLRFYYWRYYESITQMPDDEQYIENINDHSGYDICDLYIKPKYSTFGEEISNYKHINFQHYKDVVVLKVNKYQQSTFTKRIQAAKIFVPEHYEIEYKSLLQFDHILSIVLYTDYTTLSTDFSSTFRKCRPFETLDSIKKRNSVYYWFSRRLRECVEMYGHCQWSVPISFTESQPKIEKKSALSGPFYCGMNTAMHMPSFNIRLCSPTSTSIQLAVAVQFSGCHGMVIQLNNPKTAQYEYLRSFNVCWISRYKEESERLFFGGYYFTKIESIRIRATLQNFQNFIYALYYLDTMITGGRQDGGDFDDIDMKINKDDILVVKELINDKLKREPTTGSFDPYVYGTFASFSQNKQQITLNLEELNGANHEIRDILMYSVEVKKYNKEINRDKNDFANLFRMDMLMVFKNVQSMVIKTTSDYGERSYSISMEALLSLIKLRPVTKIIIKAVTTQKYNWIHALWKSSADLLKQQYDANGYNILLKKTKDYHEDQEYWFIVHKK